MHLIIYTDGASRGNPGPSSFGYIIKEKNSGVILHQEGKAIGRATNNIAEYTAFLRALEYTDKNYGHKGPHQVDFYADSLLAVQQLSGKFKIKSPHLFVLFQQIKVLEKKVGIVNYTHVPRAQNFIADRLANQALDNDR